MLTYNQVEIGHENALSGCYWLSVDGASIARGSEFLVTDYDPLSQWLDEAFEVKYKNMTLGLVFDQVPLNDIFYEVEIEEKGQLFNYSPASVTRRELLKEITDYFGLDMSLKADDAGMPKAIRVRSATPKPSESGG